MKTTFRSGINSLIALLLGLFGFGCSACLCKYGVPHGDIDVSGTVTDQESKQPIENIRITIKSNEEYAHYDEPAFPETYTETDGGYHAGHSYESWPFSQLKIVAEDTTGVYGADSTIVNLKYKEDAHSLGDSWNKGKASVRQDFQLKKK